MRLSYDVIVIGGGHAGTEAAAAAARLGVKTALVTHSFATIGTLSCNPAIGGLGKGHLVREIDALDGLMGRVADASGIQFRLLNRRKGPAVRGPRTQSDRKLYLQAMQQEISSIENLSVVEGEVVDFIMQGDRVGGIVLADGTGIAASAVVLTTGTFLGGLIHIGDRTIESGRMGERPANHLAKRLRETNLPLGRLKTGTPARLDGSTIHWDRVGKQEADDHPVPFSTMTKQIYLPQVACGVTRTNEITHSIISDNLKRSALFSGRIEGTGPRYCPSIEDKIVRFGERDGHQIFLEPEGLDDNTVYPNGISTSLPEDVQNDFIHSIVGLEEAVIRQPGYAIEYDYVDPRALTPSLACKELPGLFLAGQINGTTGYEEAGAQGLVAGLNAARLALGGESIKFSRLESYIGVMIDDLITRGVAEPYRMFTSRAEYRLSLRIDNADQRLTPRGVEIGCVGDERREKFQEKLASLAKGRSLVEGVSLTSYEAKKSGLNVSQDGVRRNGLELLAYPDIGFSDLVERFGVLGEIPDDVAEQIEIDATYAVYLERQRADVAALQKDETILLGPDFPYEGISGLSNEMKEKLKRVQPANLAHAARIEGVTPAALLLLLAHAQKGHARQRGAA